jgi:hypothetical protein
MRFPSSAAGRFRTWRGHWQAEVSIGVPPNFFLCSEYKYILIIRFYSPL